MNEIKTCNNCDATKCHGNTLGCCAAHLHIPSKVQMRYLISKVVISQDTTTMATVELFKSWM